MKMQFKNGSILESIETTSFKGTKRGKRSEFITFGKPTLKSLFLDFRLKWSKQLQWFQRLVSR